MDHEVEIMFCKPKRMQLDRNSTCVRNSVTFNRHELDDVDAEIDQIWKERLKENPKLYNGTKFRLDSINLNTDNVIFNVGITCYRDFIGTNWSPDANSIQLKGEIMHQNKQAFMSDALGVGSLLLSSDNYVTFQKRSLNCGEACGLWDIPGGHPEPKVKFKGHDSLPYHPIYIYIYSMCILGEYM